MQQITRVVDAFGSALLGELVVFAQEARQLECLQVMGEPSSLTVSREAGIYCAPSSISS